MILCSHWCSSVTAWTSYINMCTRHSVWKMSTITVQSSFMQAEEILWVSVRVKRNNSIQKQELTNLMPNLTKSLLKISFLISALYWWWFSFILALCCVGSVFTASRHDHCIPANRLSHLVTSHRISSHLVWEEVSQLAINPKEHARRGVRCIVIHTERGKMSESINQKHTGSHSHTVWRRLTAAHTGL